MLVDLNLSPSRRQLRQFGFIAVFVFALLGFFSLRDGGLFGLGFGDGATVVAAGLILVGLLSLAFSVAWPTGNAPLFIGLSLITYPVGWMVSQAVMAFLFFGILTPLGLVFRLAGRDPLERKWERTRDSYWVDLHQATDERDYFRQF